jgi:NADPH2:quinone reductase
LTTKYSKKNPRGWPVWAWWAVRECHHQSYPRLARLAGQHVAIAMGHRRMLRSLEGAVRHALPVIAAHYAIEGPATVLSVGEVDRPDPGAGQVRVQVVVSAINPTDVKGRAGLTPRPIDGFQVPHMDGAGIIDAVGPGVDPGRLGERVWVMFAALTKWGTAAQWCIVRSDQAIPLPDEATFDLGATLGVPAMTAAVCLLGSGSLAGRDVLIAGTGAVGHAAIGLARWAGARVVATVSGPEKAAIAERAGLTWW